MFISKCVHFIIVNTGISTIAALEQIFPDITVVIHLQLHMVILLVKLVILNSNHGPSPTFLSLRDDYRQRLVPVSYKNIILCFTFMLFDVFVMALYAE